MDQILGETSVFSTRLVRKVVRRDFLHGVRPLFCSGKKRLKEYRGHGVLRVFQRPHGLQGEGRGPHVTPLELDGIDFKLVPPCPALGCGCAVCGD